MGSIILTAFSSKGYLLLLCILQRLMRFTQSLFPIICSANLGGNSLFFCWPLCTLVLVTVSEFPIDGSSNAWPLQRFTNHHLRCIQYRIKEIRVIPFHCVFSEFLWYIYFIVLGFRFNSFPASTKNILFIVRAINFFPL